MQREDSINLITLFSNFWRYKWSVLMILIFILSLTFIYIKQIVPVYSSNILITIESDEASSIKSIFPNSNVVNIDMESRLDYDIAILKSRHIISKVLDNIELSHRFFIKGQWREQELYREEIPFELDLNNKRSDSGSFEFTLKELDRETFTLGLNAKEKKNQYYKYNQTIEIQGYQLKISKKNPRI